MTAILTTTTALYAAGRFMSGAADLIKQIRRLHVLVRRWRRR